MTNAFNLSQLANNTNSSGQVAAGTGISGTLGVANGGTSLGTLTTGNLLIGAGTSAVTFIAPSTSGNALISNGTTWASSAIPAPAALSTASGSAPSYSARAWIQWTSGATVAGSGNVSSITNTGTGTYTIAFTTAMPDANYAIAGNPQRPASDNNLFLTWQIGTTPVVGSFQVATANSGGLVTSSRASVSVFR